jgi:hypothetical protein
MSTVVVCLGASPWCRFGILQHIMSTGHVCRGASPWRRFGILQHITSTRRIFAWGHHRYCLSLESRKTRPAPISARRAPLTTPIDSPSPICFLSPIGATHLSNRCHPPFSRRPLLWEGRVAWAFLASERPGIVSLCPSVQSVVRWSSGARFGPFPHLFPHGWLVACD